MRHCDEALHEWLNELRGVFTLDTRVSYGSGRV
jgi:hypothetical protein